MERLTEKRDGQNVIPLRQDRKVKWALCNAGKGDSSTQYLYGEHVHKLADYENTGYPPEQVVEMAKELAEYKKLEEQGLLLKLPCKVGEHLYIFDRDGKPREMILDAPDIRCHCAKEDNLCMALCDSKDTGVCAYRLKNDGSDIDKTVFLTKEAAETELKDMEGK